MYSFEVNIMCDRDGCSSLVSGEPSGVLTFAINNAEREAEEGQAARATRQQMALAVPLLPAGG